MATTGDCNLAIDSRSRCQPNLLRAGSTRQTSARMPTQRKRLTKSASRLTDARDC